MTSARRDTVVRMLKKLFSRKRYRWVQLIARIRRVHHPRWSFGWAMPLTTWVYFQAYAYKDHGDGDRLKVTPGHWEKCERGSYHDSTTSGVY